MRQITIGNITETVVERADYPPERIKQILGNETVAVLGYGVQGRGQSLNMKDNGVHVIIGLRDKGKSWDLAQQDGWVPGKTLFSLEEAAQRGTVIQYLLSDAGQKEQWPALKPLPDHGQGPLLLARLQHRLQRPDRRDAAEGHRRDPGRSQGIRHHGAPAVPRRPRHQRQLRRSTRTPPAGPATAAWRWASPSARATCSRRPSRRKSSAT